jgi:septum formation protein
MTKDVLYLGSQSPARQKLLEQACIVFEVLTHTSDEQLAQQQMSFEEYVVAIAHSKMRSLVLPKPNEVDQDYLFVLTADTLIRNPRTKEVFGKPINREHAHAMLAEERQGVVEITTGCCFEKLVVRDGAWTMDRLEYFTSQSLAEFYVDEDAVDVYLNTIPMAIQCAGAGVIEGFGLSFLKSFQGSYSGAIGLPLYELRQVLKKHGFVF